MDSAQDIRKIRLKQAIDSTFRKNHVLENNPSMSNISSV